MRFADPLIPGRLAQRYKRFLADVHLGDGALVTVHCPNPGAMLGLNQAGAEVWLAPSRGRLPYRWELVWADGGLVGINTGHPNAVAAEAVLAGQIPELAGYSQLRREVRYGRNSRIDLLLSGSGRPDCYVEVKNVHLREGERALFPDCVTARGAKHLDELAAMVAGGARAVMLYVVQRSDCRRFAIARALDPAYGRAFDRARAAGVEMLCYTCRLSHEAIELHEPLPVDP